MTTIAVARPCDDHLVRAFLRNNPMRGWVDITIEREPSFFEGADWLGHEWAVIGREGSDLIGMYTAALRPMHVQGRPRVVGYLGGLRIDAGHRHRIRYFREGFASLRTLAPAEGDVDWWFTVIGDGNDTARRLLEAGVRGLPTYTRKGDYVTLVLPARRGRRRDLWRAARPGEAAFIAELHNRHAARYQCSPVLDACAVERIGLDRFLVHESAGQALGVVAMWDQTPFKQVVVRGYRRPIGLLRPAYNGYASAFRRLPLPAVGEALQETFLAFLALDDRALARAGALIEDALCRCRTPAAVLGLHAANPLLDVLHRFKPLQYPSGSYIVTFEEPVNLDARPMQPEAALL